VDKLTLAALESTLSLYRDPAKALRDIPALAQLTCALASLRDRAGQIRDELNSPSIEIIESEASVGGGAFPTARIPSIALAISGRADAIESRLRLGEPVVVARVADRRVIVDLRAVFPEEDGDLVAALRAAMA